MVRGLERSDEKNVLRGLGKPAEWADGWAGLSQSRR